MIKPIAVMKSKMTMVRELTTPNIGNIITLTAVAAVHKKVICANCFFPKTFAMEGKPAVSYSL